MSRLSVAEPVLIEDEFEQDSRVVGLASSAAIEVEKLLLIEQTCVARLFDGADEMIGRDFLIQFDPLGRILVPRRLLKLTRCVLLC